MSTIRISVAAVLFAVGLVPAGAQSYHGITCSDVRALSSTEQTYWADRFNLSAEQRHRIYVACYQTPFRPQGHGFEGLKERSIVSTQSLLQH